MKNFVSTFMNSDGSVSVNFNADSKSVIVPKELWERIKTHIDFLSWGELSSLVAHATRGLDVYSTNDSNENRNPNADMNWGRRRG